MLPANSPPAALVSELWDGSALTEAKFGALAHASRRAVQDWKSGARKCPPAAFELLVMALVAQRYIAAGPWMSEWVRPEFMAFFRQAL